MSNIPSTNANLQKVGKIIVLWVLCICLFWSFACWAIWDGGYFLTSLTFTDPPRWKPSVSDIVGTWKLSEDSIKKIRGLGTEIPFHEIEIYADGTFKATNLPILQGLSDNEIVFGYYTGTGTWEFDKMRVRPWAIEIHYDDYVEGITNIPGYFSLKGKQPPYKMYPGFEIITFERK